MSRLFLSEAMRESETPVVYSTSSNFSNFSYNNKPTLCISSSYSQGFIWNQDLFATQYEQNYKVIYDGHEDDLPSLIETFRNHIKRIKKKHERHISFSSPFEDESDKDNEDDYWQGNFSSFPPYGRGSIYSDRPRRKSERSISFTSDSKSGVYRKADVIDVEVDSDTPENRHLKFLLS
ncbi:Ugx2p NDAI_0A01870 [Naumovozyma dairenensis CBS 421]|uniref:Uncharacterized protein n=1 Tax=Naumovozyma dairenensis (strain ATCC 10597 / BCRC 20456 / CBS 421 / NBRC 0211 / NRRL Y-12639) TaxID=1071378 RepID=G0W3F7_NAUDC|nr:hypothetical protein NDAI_0A01870 [Naumovozyma dairenensis CBS 421]CCD22345.1 hypothetical protein NDAI_0A01870 [Naumovozyma dairenensis CBS 421]